MAAKQNGLGSMEIDGERYHTSTFEWDGVKHTVRELSSDDFTEASEAAKGPDGKVVPRQETKWLFVKALVDPPTTFERVGKFGNQKWQMVLRHFDKVNSLPEESPTTPATSAGPTSPSGGEPTLTP